MATDRFMEVKEPYPHLDLMRFATQFFIADLTLMNDIPDECPPLLRALLARCFAKEPEQRPDFQVICDTLAKIKLDQLPPASSDSEKNIVVESNRA